MGIGVQRIKGPNELGCKLQLLLLIYLFICMLYVVALTSFLGSWILEQRIWVDHVIVNRQSSNNVTCCTFTVDETNGTVAKLNEIKGNRLRKSRKYPKALQIADCVFQHAVPNLQCKALVAFEFYFIFLLFRHQNYKHCDRFRSIQYHSKTISVV